MAALIVVDVVVALLARVIHHRLRVVGQRGPGDVDGEEVVVAHVEARRVLASHALAVVAVGEGPQVRPDAAVGNLAQVVGVLLREVPARLAVQLRLADDLRQVGVLLVWVVFCQRMLVCGKLKVGGGGAVMGWDPGGRANVHRRGRG